MLSFSSSRMLRAARGKLTSTLRWVATSSPTTTPAAVASSEITPAWCIISGFSIFVSRKDLHVVLGDIEAIIIDPILDHNAFSTGKYALQLENSAAVTLLDKQIKEKYPYKYEIKSYSEDEVQKLVRASKYNITGCTIRLRYCSLEVQEGDIALIFEDFRVRPGGIVALPLDEKWKHFLVHFESAAEAERAVIEKADIKVNGRALKMGWYQH